jgi:anti-sigma regulatory factor (Ser/Thr protein kinase)
VGISIDARAIVGKEAGYEEELQRAGRFLRQALVTALLAPAWQHWPPPWVLPSRPRSGPRIGLGAPAFASTSGGGFTASYPVLAQSGQRAEPSQAWSLRVRLPRSASCSTVARRLLAEYAREQLSEHKAEDMMLVVSELATNAFLHGYGAITMTASRVDDRLRIDMRDEGHPDRIAPLPEAEQGPGGRGLWLVERLASAWGTTAGSGHVWAELALATPRS